VVTTTSFDDAFGVNVRGTLLTVQKALPLMTAGGSVITNRSADAVRGVPRSTTSTPLARPPCGPSPAPVFD